MKQIIEKYFCDYCNREMSEFEYEQRTRLGVRIDLPNPSGKCGQVAGINMSLCQECTENMGIVNSEEYHDYNYSKGRLTEAIKENKNTLLDVLFRRNK